MSSGIEIRHLRYFLAVAETESYTRAAQRLQISQPSVSQQISILEEMLATPLFRQVGRRAVLTEAGVAFRKGAEAVLRKLEDACRAVGDVAGLVTGHVDLGVIPALHIAWVPPVLDRIAREFPGVTVSVRERASSEIENELEAGRLDLGFGLAGRPSQGIRHDRLLAEAFALIIPPDHALASQSAISPKSLDGMPLVLLPRSFDMRLGVEEMFRRDKIRPRIQFEIDHIDSALAVVARSGFPTLLPPIVLRGREVLGLRAISLGSGIRALEFGLMQPRGAPLSPAAAVVARVLKEMLGSVA